MASLFAVLQRNFKFTFIKIDLYIMHKFKHKNFDSSKQIITVTTTLATCSL